MVILWIFILAAMIGLTALYGGRNCKVPANGPFNWLLQGEKFVPTGSTSFRRPPCARVK